MMHEQAQGDFVHALALGEGKGFTDETAQKLTQDVVPSLDVAGLARTFAAGEVGAPGKDFVVSQPPIVAGSAAAVVGRDVLTQGTGKRKRFAATTIGYVHIDSCERRTAEGKTHLFLAIDRISKFVFVESHPRATSMIGAAFLRNVLTAFPYKLHTILTDNSVAFTDCASTKYDFKVHPFNRICIAHGIKHKLTKPYHPWTNGQAERMNRPLKEATVKSFHYETLASLTAHLQAFVLAYNFAKHLKVLRWKTPFQTICDA